MKVKVITNNEAERRKIGWDKTRFWLNRIISRNIAATVITDIWNPREAQEIADFINENNTEYKEENGGWDWIKVHK